MALQTGHDAPDYGTNDAPDYGTNGEQPKWRRLAWVALILVTIFGGWVLVLSTQLIALVEQGQRDRQSAFAGLEQSAEERRAAIEAQRADAAASRSETALNKAAARQAYANELLARSQARQANAQTRWAHAEARSAERQRNTELALASAVEDLQSQTVDLREKVTSQVDAQRTRIQQLNQAIADLREQIRQHDTLRQQ